MAFGAGISVKLVNVAKAPLRVTPNHVPPASTSSPLKMAREACLSVVLSDRHVAGAAGRVRNSSRLLIIMLCEYNQCARTDCSLDPTSSKKQHTFCTDQQKKMLPTWFEQVASRRTVIHL